MLRPLSSAYDTQRDSDWLLSGGGGGGVARDESNFYQAETHMLTRENQMLKQRIRELERLLGQEQGHGQEGIMEQRQGQEQHVAGLGVRNEAASPAAAVSLLSDASQPEP